MMRKLSGLILACLLLMTTGQVFSDTLLDAASVTTLHQQLVSAFVSKCQSEMNMTAAICECLAGKFDQAIDDGALRHCSNDMSGTDCVSNQVTLATQNALIDENILNCVNNNVAGGNTTNSSATSSFPGVSNPSSNLSGVFGQ